MERMNCCSCNAPEESHDHLFFGCPFTKIIWKNNVAMCKLNYVPMSWRIVLKIWRLNGKLLFGASIYVIWKEWNERLFKGEENSLASIPNNIKLLAKKKPLNGELEFGQEVGSANGNLLWWSPVPRLAERNVFFFLTLVVLYVVSHLKIQTLRY